jgi:4'-phosphopantetheinyl transferase
VTRDVDWLSANETARLNGKRYSKSSDDWRQGRWTAKRALAAYLNVPAYPEALTDIELRPAPSGAPEVFFANKPAAVTVSLSHRAGRALCAVTLSGAALGCDLEIIEPRSDGFVADYFTAEEQALVAEASPPDRPRRLALLWSAKESALKALRVGLRLDTRCVIVSPVDVGRPAEGGEGRTEDPALAMRASDGVNTWRPLHVRCTDGQLFHGWWHNTGHLLRTMVTAPPPAPPIPLRIRT